MQCKSIGLMLLLILGWSLTSCQRDADRSDTETTSQSEQSTASEVEWLEGQTWDEIVSLATERDRPILIDFYATWCGPCKKLDKEVYTVPAVISELEKFVTFKVDVDKPEYADLKQQFSIFNMPTLVLCQADGTEIDRFLGFRPPEEFLETVRDYQAGRNTLAAIEAQLRQSPDDPELLLSAGTKHALRLQEDRAIPMLERVVRLDPDNARGLAGEATIQIADMSWKAGRYDEAIATYRRILTEFVPNEPDAGDQQAEECLQMIAYCQKKKGDLAGMVDTYRELMRRDPEDVGAMNGFAWNAAQAGTALEDATDIALKAVALSDEDPGVMDTLAEVYHARNMHREAIAWIKKAIAKEPDDSYFKEQLAKFEEAAQSE